MNKSSSLDDDEMFNDMMEDSLMLDDGNFSDEDINEHEHRINRDSASGCLSKYGYMNY